MHFYANKSFPTNDFVFDGDDSYILFVGPSEATQARVSTSSGKNNRQNVGKYIQFYVNTVILLLFKLLVYLYDVNTNIFCCPIIDRCVLSSKQLSVCQRKKWN